MSIEIKLIFTAEEILALELLVSQLLQQSDAIRKRPSMAVVLDLDDGEVTDPVPCYVATQSDVRAFSETPKTILKLLYCALEEGEADARRLLEIFRGLSQLSMVEPENTKRNVFELRDNLRRQESLWHEEFDKFRTPKDTGVH